jgi:hypothetical protein
VTDPLTSTIVGARSLAASLSQPPYLVVGPTFAFLGSEEVCCSPESEHQDDTAFFDGENVDRRLEMTSFLPGAAISKLSSRLAIEIVA